MKVRLALFACLLMLASTQAASVYVTPELQAVNHDAILGVPNWCVDAHHYAMSRQVQAEENVPMGTSNPALACTTYLNWAVDEGFTLAADLTPHIFVSCNYAAVSGDGAVYTFRFVLYRNGEAVGGQGNGQGTGNACTGETEWTASIAETAGASFAAGDTLTVRVLHWHLTPPAEVGNLDLIAGRSYFEDANIPRLVVESEGEDPDVDLPQTYQLSLTTETADATHSYDSPHNDTYRYNWTTESGSVDVSYEAMVGNGSVVFTITDANGTGVMESTVTSNFNDTQSFEGLEPGNWTIEVAFTEFTGDFHFTVAPQSEEEPTGTETGTNTPTNDGSDKKDSPAGILPILALLGAGLVAMRRRID